MGAEDEFSPLLGFEEAPSHFQSASQRARVWTETWVRTWLYCPHCGEPHFGQFENNRPVADFYCGNCREEFELKSKNGRFGPKVVDGAYDVMRQRVAAQNNPNLILLSYAATSRAVTNVLVVPKQFFVHDIIEPRKPLGPHARRAGWRGCNILLSRIPASGRVFLIKDQRPIAKGDVRDRWRSTLFLRTEGEQSRGWLLEIMKAVDAIDRAEFTLEEVYRFEDHLSSLFPGNRNVRPKIRQQLQVLRDRGYLEFTGRGKYRRRAAGDLAP